MNYWLMKTEPDVFSIEDLIKKGQSPWDGVRGFAARKHMREMKLGDKVLFYHSSCKPKGIAGLAVVAREAYPDASSWNPDSPYFDPKSRADNPYWVCVDLVYEKTFKKFLTLESLKLEKSIQGLILFKEHRLSVQPVGEKEFEIICRLGDS
jgi:predicted RNA-binding protein with PUA-like domain